jgi:hypothetical protein
MKYRMYAFKNVHCGMACLRMEEYYEFDLCVTTRLIKEMKEDIINHY